MFRSTLFYFFPQFLENYISIYTASFIIQIVINHDSFYRFMVFIDWQLRDVFFDLLLGQISHHLHIFFNWQTIDSFHIQAAIFFQKYHIR